MLDLDALFEELEALVTQSATWAPHRLIAEMHRLKARYEAAIDGENVVITSSSVPPQLVSGLQVEHADMSSSEPATELHSDNEPRSDISEHEPASEVRKPPRRAVRKGTA